GRIKLEVVLDVHGQVIVLVVGIARQPSVDPVAGVRATGRRARRVVRRTDGDGLRRDTAIDQLVAGCRDDVGVGLHRTGGVAVRKGAIRGLGACIDVEDANPGAFAG